MATQNILIKLTTGDGAADRFEYVPYVPKIDSSVTEDVKWTCEVDGESANTFAIHFTGASPCNKGRKRTSTGSITLALNTVSKGRFHYYVAVYHDGEIWTDDPDMIVW